MQPPERTRGFFTFAQNTNTTDYIRLAYGLALSLKHSQKNVSNLSIAVTPGTIVDSRYKWAFDQIIEIPWGDQAEDSNWKLENEWKSPWMSPYDETIKLDCDMLFLTDISSWWDALGLGDDDIVWTNSVLDWRGGTITNDYYRKVFTANSLPNIYTAFCYFRKSPTVFETFELAKLITWNWERFFELFLEPNTRPTYFSTDVAFALAVKIIDFDQSSYIARTYPTFTHMKSHLQGWTDDFISENWQDHLKTFFTSDCDLKIGNHRQIYPLHYNVKNFLSDEIITAYESLLQK